VTRVSDIDLAGAARLRQKVPMPIAIGSLWFVVANSASVA
jgi:hypothetical protein